MSPSSRPLARKSRSSWKLWIVPVLILLFVANIAYNNRETVLSWLGMGDGVATVDDYSVGDSVVASGALMSSDNIRLYTMRLTDAEGTTFGLKSSVLDMSTYRDMDVMIRGTVVDFVGKMPILNVISLVPTDNTLLTGNVDGEYFNKAGVLIESSAASSYSFQSIEGDQLVFADSLGNELSIEFFACTTDGGSKDCGFMKKSFANTASSSFVGRDGDMWLNLPQTTTWFGNNDDRFGYRTYDVDQNALNDVLKNVRFINDDYIAKNILPEIKDLCRSIDHTLLLIDEYEVLYGNTTSLVIMGSDAEDNLLTCTVQVAIDGSSAPTLISLEVDGEKVDAGDDSEEDKSDDNDSEDSNDVLVDPSDVEQFPLGTKLPFTSSKGYTIVFPASNIAFQGDNNTESLGIDGVSGCYTQLNVTKFADAEDILENPSVVMYDCTNVDSSVTDFKGYVKKYGSESGKTFLIKAMDPSWTNFANSIEVE
jgi:hypothetical protein